MGCTQSKKSHRISNRQIDAQKALEMNFIEYIINIHNNELLESCLEFKKLENKIGMNLHQRNDSDHTIVNNLSPFRDNNDEATQAEESFFKKSIVRNSINKLVNPVQNSTKVVPVNKYAISNPTYESLATLRNEQVAAPEGMLPPINFRRTISLDMIREIESKIQNQQEEVKEKAENQLNPYCGVQEESFVKEPINA